jgi:glycosyltransferase involved in cell wall biosynthesis
VRVLLVNLGYPPNVVGGAELLVQSLARELAGRGVRTSVVSLSQNGKDWQYDDGGVRAYFVHAHPMGIALLNPERTLAQRVVWHALGEANIWISRKLSPVLAREQPDIVNTHSLLGLSVNAWKAVQAFGAPIAHTLHDYQLLCPRGTMFRRREPCAHQCGSCRLLTARRRAASAIPAAVLGISQFILGVHSAHGYFPNAMKTVVPNGFRPPARAQPRAPAAPAAPLRIGFIGRLHPIKGVELLLDALRRLPPGSYAAKVAGSGSPNYEAFLRERAQGLAVEFMGWTTREEFYRQIDILVVPSLYHEPQGMVLIEAASFGIPVIYARRGGLSELGAEFPRFRSFDPSRPDSLGEALLAVAAQPETTRDFRTTAGPVARPFTLEGFVDGYLQAYERVLSAKRAQGWVAGLSSSASGEL